LRQLNDNASPQALDELPQEARLAAFAPSPTILTATDILFDAWSLTTIRGKLPGRPPVEPYLHGISEWQPPETHVAWREEVGIITDDLLDDYPLKPHELLRDTSSRVFDRLKKLKADPTTPVWVVNDDGTVKPTTLGELLAARGKAKEIKGKTVLLPPKAGGLANGLLTSNAGFADDVPYDVADKWYDEHGNPRRCRIWDDDEPPDGMRLIRTIDTRPDIDAEDESSERRFWHWYESPLSGDGDGSKSSRKAVCWKVHTCDVTRNVERIVEPLRLTSEMKRAIVLAARFHDLGKRRTVFQTMLGNRDYPELVLAKSGKRGSRLAETYRHEFGSLVDVQQEAEFRQLDDDLQDLVLHLIAAHHGRGRPHFPADEAFDPEQPQAEWNRVACDVPRRFARLQRKYGRWGLAYLESLLRAADWAASANPSAFVEDQA
jgi:CRISPR-associated endonuclease/helicase Cas3